MLQLWNKIKCLFVLFIAVCSLSFTGCLNAVEAEPSESKSAAEAAAEVCKVSGKIDLRGAIPANTFQSSNNSRSIFPHVGTAADYYYKINAISTSASSTKPLSFELGKVTSYSITLPCRSWKLVAEGYEDSTYTKRVLSGVICEDEDFSSPAVILNPTTLKPVSTDTGTGNVDLIFILESETNIVSGTASFNGTTQSLDALAGISLSFKLTDYPCGLYDVTFSFYDDKNQLVYFIKEPLYIFENLTTNRWVSSAPYVSEEGIIHLTEVHTSQFKMTSFYVSSDGSDSGTGGYFSPFKTIQHAVDVIKSINNPEVTYSINLLSDIAAQSEADCSVSSLDVNSGRSFVTIDYEDDSTLMNVKIQSCGNPALPYKIDANGAVTDARVLFAGKNVSLTLSNIEITGGRFDTESGDSDDYSTSGSGLLIYGRVDSSARIQIENCLIDGNGLNSVTTKGSAIYLKTGNLVLNTVTMSGNDANDIFINDINGKTVTLKGLNSISQIYYNFTERPYSPMLLNNITGSSIGIQFNNTSTAGFPVLQLDSEDTGGNFTAYVDLITCKNDGFGFEVADSGISAILSGSATPIVYSNWSELCAAVAAIPAGTTTKTTFRIGGTMTADQTLAVNAPVKLITVDDECTVTRDAAFSDAVISVTSELIIHGEETVRITFNGNNVLTSSPFISVNNGALDLQYSDIKNCHSTSSGAAVYINTTENANFVSCKFINNMVDASAAEGSSGAAIYFEGTTTSSSFYVSDSQFDLNRVEANSGTGGAIRINTKANDDIRMNECNFSDNYAKAYGGAIYTAKGSVYFEDINMQGNKVGDDAVQDVYVTNQSGGVYIEGTISLPMLYIANLSGNRPTVIQCGTMFPSSIAIDYAYKDFNFANAVITQVGYSEGNFSDTITYITPPAGYKFKVVDTAAYLELVP